MTYFLSSQIREIKLLSFTKTEKIGQDFREFGWCNVSIMEITLQKKIGTCKYFGNNLIKRKKVNTSKFSVFIRVQSTDNNRRQTLERFYKPKIVQ